MCVNFSEIKCIIDAFGSHLDIDLQQRSVEFSQLFKAHSNLRPALLEKMPPMQITRISNQNSEFNEESESGELILNGSDDDQENKKIATSDSVSGLGTSKFRLLKLGTNFWFNVVCRMPYWIFLVAISVR